MDPGEAVRMCQVVLSGAQTPAGAAWSTLRTQEDCRLHFRKARAPANPGSTACRQRAPSRARKPKPSRFF
jgi:hypothetical protein